MISGGGGSLPASVALGLSPGSGQAVGPTVLLDTYYDAATYANKTAAINAAVAAVQALGGTLECRTGRVYSLDAGALSIAPGAAITILGNRATLQSNWSKPRCIDFTGVADYDTFTNVDIRDLTFDANNVTSASNESIVGNRLSGDSAERRVNFQHIYVRRCIWKNVPVAAPAAPTQTYACFSLTSQHLASGETQTNLIDIRLEQAYMRGGDVGAAVTGSCSTGTLPVEVYHDKIYLDVDHDTGVVPTVSAIGANVQIGSTGWGDSCEVHLIGANSADTGIEIDGMQSAHVWGQVTDAWNQCFLGTNFHTPRDLASQRYVYHGCLAKAVNINPAVGSPQYRGFQPGSLGTGILAFGEMVLEDCAYYNAFSQLRGFGDAIAHPVGTVVRALTIVGQFTASFPNVNDSSAAGRHVYLTPGGSSFALKGGDIRVAFAGTGGSGGIIVSVDLSPQTGCAMLVELGEIMIASSLASQGASRTHGLDLGASGAGGGSIRGRIRKLGWESFSGGDTTPQLLCPTASTVFTFDGRLVIDELDFRKDPASNPGTVSGNNAIDNTNRAGLVIRSATKKTYPLASVAMAAPPFATATWTTATGNQYLGGLPAEIHFANATGAGITAIAASKDGTTYENVYEQASGAMAQDVLVPVENADFVMVTFATTAPTARIRYRRAQ